MNLIEFYPDIKKHPIFKNSNNIEINRYIKKSDFHVQTYHPGDDICSPSTSNGDVGMIIHGCASVSSKDEEKNVLLRTMGVGAMFGIANLYSDHIEFPTKIVAKSACEVLFIKKDSIKNLIENDKNTLKCFLAFQSNKIVYLNKKINSFTAGGAERRLSLFLLDNAIDGVYSADVSMSALAEMLDIGRASLYRAFDTLENAGHIERKDKKTIIVNQTLISEKYSDKANNLSAK